MIVSNLQYYDDYIKIIINKHEKYSRMYHFCLYDTPCYTVIFTLILILKIHYLKIRKKIYK